MAEFVIFNLLCSLPYIDFGKIIGWKRAKIVGPTRIRTGVIGFKVQCDSHYTIGPLT